MDCIAIQSLGHDTALGRALGTQAGVGARNRCAVGRAGLSQGVQGARGAPRRAQAGAGGRWACWR